MWDLLEEYMITEEDAANGTHPLKEVQFQSSCNGGTNCIAEYPEFVRVN